MSWISATDDHKNSHWYEADCDKINYKIFQLRKLSKNFKLFKLNDHLITAQSWSNPGTNNYKI